jgi:hypothetical protein
METRSAMAAAGLTKPLRISEAITYFVRPGQLCRLHDATMTPGQMLSFASADAVGG